MEEILSEHEDRLRKAAEKDDESFETYKQAVQDRFQELKEEEDWAEHMGDSEVMTTAVMDITSDDYSEFRGSAESHELPILSIGHQGIQTWQRDTPNERRVLIAHGITLDPSQSEEGSPPPIGPASFIIEESDVPDIYAVRDCFEPMNSLRGTFSITDSDVSGAYVCNSQEGETDVEKAEIEDIPTEPKKIRQIFHQHMEEVELRNIADNLSQYEVNDDGSRGFTTDYGVDMKWMEGKVIDKYIRRESDCEPGENPFAVYTLLDTQIVDESELEGTKVLDEDGPEGRTLGLSAFIDTSMADFAEGSLGEFYGTVEFNEERNSVNMNIVGFVPFRKKPIEDASAADDDVEEETI